MFHDVLMVSIGILIGAFMGMVIISAIVAASNADK